MSSLEPFENEDTNDGIKTRSINLLIMTLCVSWTATMPESEMCLMPEKLAQRVCEIAEIVLFG